MKHKVADIAMAVAIQGGLLTPVLRNVASKSLSEISLNTKDLIKRSKEKKLDPVEFSGGTITISNLGMFGIDSSFLEQNFEDEGDVYVKNPFVPHSDLIELDC